MLFSSPIFIVYFLPLFLLGYLLSPVRWKNAVALFGSFVFYAWGAPVFALLLLVSGTADFYLSRQLVGKAYSKRWLFVGVVYNVVTLFIFKYFNFFTENARLAMESLGFEFPAYMEIALPIGISFFTFQKISYLVDVYREDTPKAKSLQDYLLFVFLFPQLIAGPIVRYKDIATQITTRFPTDAWPNRLSGFYRFSLGLAKKVLIADALAPLVDLTFGDASLGFAQAWLGLLAYAVQIYFDFSGYSDMAIGLGQMMGFRFPENFNWPYLAKGFRDFWHRWHITLSTWMRDYLYLPLGGSRASAERTMINLWLVFLLSGLWHGASWNFVIWGAWHGAFICLDRFTGFFKRMPSAVSVMFTFLIVLIGWVWFRTETLTDAVGFLGALSRFGFGNDIVVTSRQLTLLVFALAFAFLPRSLHAVFINGLQSKNSASDIWKSVLSIALIMLSLGQLALVDSQPFIYFRF